VVEDRPGCARDRTTGASGERDGERAPEKLKLMLQFSPMVQQIAKTFWAITQAYTTQLGLSTTTVRILGILGEQDGLAQQELTKYLHLDPSMVTRTVKELEHERGWIRRERDPVDQRLMRVYLTPAGRVQAQELPGRARALEERLLRGMDEAEREYLRQTLRNLEEAARGDHDHTPGNSPQT
jgi:DNA-binding MarR family transcriptional regulator